MTANSFNDAFATLTCHRPFPWQEELYQKFLTGSLPSRCHLPTGVGKTNIIALWLLALANGADLPRRLVYVVNRRTVVDQTTAEVERLLKNLPKLQISGFDKLAISTLRGQFADNREWSADPSRPAVIVGTVDMIGSRLLFSGYGVGFKARPLHAGFLGQDALLVHDEAHLEPAFQQLISTIRKEQKRERARNGTTGWQPLQVIELTATSRSDHAEPPQGIETFTLTTSERTPPDDLPNPPSQPLHHIWRRIKAVKALHLIEVEDEKAITAKIIATAQCHAATGNAVLIFVQSLEAVADIQEKLGKKLSVVPLTGTMRGYERDRMAREDPVFQRFLPEKSRNSEVKPAEGTVFLVCTSAGEVGIDISADHLVCDLSSFESMAQRFGRVNRYGDRPDSRIDVVYPAKMDEKHPLTGPRTATLELLKKLQGDASPLSLEKLDPKEKAAAFSPLPAIPAATDILFDAWALTSIRQAMPGRRPMPGRPPVAPYLHGIADWEPPETHVAWRQEVEVITGELLDRYPPVELLDQFPLLPHELLRDRSDRIFEHLQRLARKHRHEPIWLIDPQGRVVDSTLEKVADPAATKSQDKKPLIKNIAHCTVLLPPSVGGLKDGFLNADADQTSGLDVAEKAKDAEGRPRRSRTWDDAEAPKHLRRILTIDTLANDIASESDETPSERFWHWYASPHGEGRTSKSEVRLGQHTDHVVTAATQILCGLDLPREISQAVLLAARLHDAGKNRERFQHSIGNIQYPSEVLAKSRKRVASLLQEPFRHEFASALDAQRDPEFRALSAEMQDLVLHLIAAHHGRARPHFETSEAFDPEGSGDEPYFLALETPRRFARLQRKYGRWGLAYLESLLRAADWAASAAELEETS